MPYEYRATHAADVRIHRTSTCRKRPTVIPRRMHPSQPTSSPNCRNAKARAMMTGQPSQWSRGAVFCSRAKATTPATKHGA